MSGLMIKSGYYIYNNYTNNQMNNNISTAKSYNIITTILGNRVLLAPLLIFIIGAPTIFLTKLVFYLLNPDFLTHRVPTISKAAAYAPGYYIFLAGTLPVCVCIITTVFLVYKLYIYRIDRLSLPHTKERNLKIIIITGCVCCILASLSLGLLSIISLKINNPVHVGLSIAFFAFQSFAYIFDTISAIRIKKLAFIQHIDIDNLSLNGKPQICIILSVIAVFYLFMFLTKDSSLYSDEYLVHQVYTITEYIWANLAFLYPALYYPEIKNHIKKHFVENNS